MVRQFSGTHIKQLCSHGWPICVTKVMLTLDECQHPLFVDLGVLQWSLAICIRFPCVRFELLVGEMFLAYHFSQRCRLQRQQPLVDELLN